MAATLEMLSTLGGLDLSLGLSGCDRDSRVSETRERQYVRAAGRSAC